MLKYVLSRKDYEDIYILGGMMDPLAEVSAREAADVMARAYPKNCGQAASELRTRGLAVHGDDMDAVATSGQIPVPARDRNGEAVWQSADIDAAAEVFEAAGRYTPEAAAWEFLNVEPGQAKRALQEALDAYPGHGRDEFELRVFPAVSPSAADPSYTFSTVFYVLNTDFLAAREKLRQRLAQRPDPKP
jgi:hypothetical protein